VCVCVPFIHSCLMEIACNSHHNFVVFAVMVTSFNLAASLSLTPSLFPALLVPGVHIPAFLINKLSVFIDYWLQAFYKFPLKCPRGRIYNDVTLYS